MIPIIITGASGRMGKELIDLILASKEYKLVGATENSSSKLIGQKMDDIFVTKNLTEVQKPSGVIIDFTAPEATMTHLDFAVLKKIPLVIGTTGFSPTQIETIKQASKKIPLVFSPNMSVGVNALFKLIADAARILGPHFDLEIFEAHHRLKKDAPSGTAVKIAEILAEATRRTYPDDFNFHREGLVGARPQKEIGMQVLRGGDIVGEHTVFYCGEGERLEIKHVATSRKTFASGALRAAAWLLSQKPGLYTMKDVLGL